jgi:phosphoribosyl 1,2-cyclic phosphodiesterase
MEVPDHELLRGIHALMLVSQAVDDVLTSGTERKPPTHEDHLLAQAMLEWRAARAAGNPLTDADHPERPGTPFDTALARG